jgi:hypothetical protein
MMSGFRSRGRPTAPRGSPGCGLDPILGYLFGSEQNIEQEVEGMIFIVPTVVEGISRSAQDRVAEALRQYEQFSGDMDDVRLYDPTGAVPINASRERLRHALVARRSRSPALSAGCAPEVTLCQVDGAKYENDDGTIQVWVNPILYVRVYGDELFERPASPSRCSTATRWSSRRRATEFHERPRRGVPVPRAPATRWGR